MNKIYKKILPYLFLSLPIIFTFSLDQIIKYKPNDYSIKNLNYFDTNQNKNLYSSKLSSFDQSDRYFQSEIKTKLDTLDWVQSVEIVRIWPNKIDIRIMEETLVGIWNNDLILNSSGKLYVLDQRSIPENIPQLNGPKGSERDVMNLFIKIDSLLIGRGLYLEAITLDARGSWSFTIKPKIEIKLGKTEINQKLERFFLALDQSLLAKINKVSYIDLRYSEGLAVSWNK